MSFLKFWELYPRKVAKKHALMMWHRLTAEQQEKALATINAHMDYWSQTGRETDKIPHAGSWLNGWRFDDEIEPVKAKVSQIAWWASEAGVIAKGQEMGLEARPGESTEQFKGRVNQALQRRPHELRANQL